MNSKRLLVLATSFLLLFFIFGGNVTAAETLKYWIFFRDKGPLVLSKRTALVEKAVQRLSPRALQRRAKALPPTALVNESDFDLYHPYIDELSNRGFKPVVSSRWLNAVSVFATPEESKALQELPFVKSVQQVARLQIPPVPVVEPPPPSLFKPTNHHRFEYGNSLAQIEQIRAAELHDAGIFGTGVIVGMLDSGFRWQEHEAFQHLKGKVIAEHDFINNDEVTRNESGDPSGQDSHGTQTLSALGAFKPGELIGPAFGARFIFAKTENIASETHAEEDFWAEAIEWMEGLGVEVTSTSLGYSQVCPFRCCPFSPEDLYTPADMDGKTAIITKAAEIAVSKGVIVVNSAGNSGDCPWHIITAPADGPHVIAAGAVFSSGGVVDFSSRGPTADGRIKPDVMAMGAGVQVVSPGSKNGYNPNASGTSFSCPLAAGVVAQIVSAHPDLTPAKMMEALRNTASQAHQPDNDYGWGIVNARAAVTYWGPAFSNEPEVDTSQSGVFTVTMRILSRDGITPGSVRIHYASPNSTIFAAATMAPIDSISYAAPIPRPAQRNDTIRVYFSAVDSFFGEVKYPKPAPDRLFLIRGDGILLNAGELPPALPRSFALKPNYPNPFGSSLKASITRFFFDLPRSGPVRIRVFNVLGQRVRTIFDGELAANRYEIFYWDGTDDLQRPVAGGVYFYEVSTPVGTGRGKMLLLR